MRIGRFSFVVYRVSCIFYRKKARNCRCLDKRYTINASLYASAHLRPSHPKATMLSLLVLRCALRLIHCPSTSSSGKPHGRCIGTRESRNVKPLRLRDTALATLDGVCSRLRCCTPLPLFDTLFQRLALLSDTSLAPNAWAAPSRSALHCERDKNIITFYPRSGALALYACGRADLSPIEHVG